MSKLLSAFFVAASAFAFAPSSLANGCNGGGGGGNNQLQCDAGGPYTVGAQAPFVTVQLDGRDSTNETGYAWTTTFPGALFDDAASGTPTLTIPVSNDCSFNVVVRLTVTNGNNSKSCHATVRVRDCTPPVITCPENAKVFCGSDTSPDALGRATATDNCDTDVKVTYKDTVTPGACAADRFDSVIRRRWKATDNDCNQSVCFQTIDVVKNVTKLDVRPGVCPNGYDPDACDLLPVAILGLDGFNVGNIQWNTVKLYGRNCDGGPVSAQCFTLADVAGPFFGGAECDCSAVGPDGKLDLVGYFKRSKLNQRLGLDDLPAGSVVSVVVTGRLCDGCKFVAEDCLLIL
ncbi:MAG: hypothetical protein NTY35_04250 [Planctomycetota bacterium]|nr:hypothetical protein [Planctomycetota bacterium]